MDVSELPKLSEVLAMYQDDLPAASRPESGLVWRAPNTSTCVHLRIRCRALSSCLFEGEYESVRWTGEGASCIEWPKATSWCAKRRAEKGVGRGMGRGCPLLRENFEIWVAVWCDLVHFGKKLTFLQLSTFVNENIAIMCSTVVLSSYRPILVSCQSLLNGSSLRVSSVTLRRTNFFQTVSHRTAEVTPPRQPYSVSITT